MKIENINRLKSIIQSIFKLDAEYDCGSISQENFRQWDSLAKIKMIVTIEGEFGVGIATNEYEQFTSFNSIMNLLAKKGL